MKEFFVCVAEGVIGVVTPEVYTQIEDWNERSRAAANGGSSNLTSYPSPVFTFSDLIGLRSVVTGNLENFEEFVVEGCEIYEADFHVPFSDLRGAIRTCPNLDQFFDQLISRPSMTEVLTTFGLIRPRDRQPQSSGTRIPVPSA